jgi:hypothetical protein
MLDEDLGSLEDKRERLMDLALDGPFGKDEIARRAASLEAERDVVERELDGLGPGALEGRLRELEELPNLVEGYLREVRHADFASCHGLREPPAPADLCTR